MVRFSITSSEWDEAGGVIGVHSAGVAAPRRVVLLTGLLAFGLTACGSGGGGPASSARPSAVLPTRSAPASTGSAAAEPSASPSPRPTLTLPTRSPVDPPVPNPTPTTKPAPLPPPTQSEATSPPPTREPTATPASSSAAAAAPAASSSSSPWEWWWWLIGLLIALGLGALVLVVRRRRARNLWETQLGGVVAESRWLAHELLPSVLSTESPVGRRGIWIASRPRVETLETSLRTVAASAPQSRLDRLYRLQAAVTDLRSAVDAYAATARPDHGESLGAARQAQRQLEEALRAFQPRVS